jgi:glycosyltransferase involved in cell wall biosynthesis
VEAVLSQRDENAILSSCVAERPRLSVVIPVLNGADVLPECLRALRRSDFQAFEVLVVDDGSSDATPQIAEEYGVRHIRTVSTRGPANARNLGARHAVGDILVFVDADVVLPPSALSRIADTFDSNPSTAGVFGSYDDAPAHPAFFSQYKNLMHHYIHQKSRESASTFWAGCGAMRKSVFEHFGGFDAARYTEPTIEDVALGMELAHAGHSIVLDKQLTVKHLKRWTFFTLLKTDIVHRAIPWTRLILNTRHLPDDLNFDYSARASVFLIAGLAVASILLGIGTFQQSPHATATLLGSAVLLGVTLLVVNRHVYLFFLRKRGWWFAARGVLVHWAYYLYSGVTFLVIAIDHYLVGRHKKPKPVPVTGTPEKRELL